MQRNRIKFPSLKSSREFILKVKTLLLDFSARELNRDLCQLVLEVVAIENVRRTIWLPN